MRNKLAFIACGYFGLIGILGQVYFIRHDLVLSYPYKMMGRFYPLYERIGDVGALIAPVIAIGIMLGVGSIRRSWARYLMPAAATITCPIVFWLVFEFLYGRAAFSAAERSEGQFDGLSADGARSVLMSEALELAFLGVLVGLGCGLAIYLLERWRPRFGSKPHLP